MGSSFLFGKPISAQLPMSHVTNVPIHFDRTSLAHVSCHKCPKLQTPLRRSTICRENQAHCLASHTPSRLQARNLRCTRLLPWPYNKVPIFDKAGRIEYKVRTSVSI